MGVPKPRYQFTLANLLRAVGCLAIALGLTRCYPANPYGLISPAIENLPGDAVVNAMLIVAVCGAAGAIQSRFQGFALVGAHVAFGVVMVWAICRFYFLIWAAGSV